MATKRGTGGPLTQAMRQKLKRAGYRSRYRLRKQIVEPVFGQIKQARGFRQFLLRGIEKVRGDGPALHEHNRYKNERFVPGLIIVAALFVIRYAFRDE